LGCFPGLAGGTRNGQFQVCGKPVKVYLFKGHWTDYGVWRADELVMMMGSGGMKLKEVQGMYFDPFSRKWSLTDDLAVNYIAAFTWL